MGERKRRVKCNEGEGDSEDSLICKRHCGLSPEAEELLHILEDAEEDRCVPEEEIVCGVMKSLEEEIRLCCSSEIEAETRTSDVPVDEITYLLSASDDELGIPPSPSVWDSPLYDCESCVGFSDIEETMFWHLEDGNCKSMATVSSEGVEEDFTEFFQGE